MIVVLSPSKSMDMEATKVKTFTEPAFLEQSQKLVQKARRFSTPELMEFMDISETLAELNRRRFKQWSTPFSPENAKQAVLAFTGDVYEGLDANTLKATDLKYAQNHLRILSGLYGLLKPLDLIQPYRLEMGRPLETENAKNLYAFWKSTITEELNRTKGNILVNLASTEYFKAIDAKSLGKEIVEPAFKEEKNGQFKMVSFFAKKARGTMARFIIENRIENASELEEFAEDGYRYNAKLSEQDKPVFTRRQP